MMTFGEKSVWSAAFVAALYAGKFPMEAATQAATAVMAARSATALGIGQPLLLEPTQDFVLACIKDITTAPEPFGKLFKIEALEQ